MRSASASLLKAEKSQSHLKERKHQLVLERTTADVFEDIILSDSMYRDHFPDVYEDKLKQLFEENKSVQPSVDELLY